MTRFSALFSSDENPLRQPLNKDAYRVLGIVGVMGTLLGATIGFIAVPRWDVAMAFALLSIPGSLFAGVLAILLEQHTAAKRTNLLQMISSVAIILVSAGAVFGLRYVIPSMLIRVIVLTVVSFLILSAVNIYRRRKGGH